MSSEAVGRIVEQNVEIYDALRGAGLPAELILNPLNEPLAVVSRGVINPAKIVTARSVTLAMEAGDFTSPTGTDTLRNTLPISGDKVYPAEYTAIFDLVVQAAARRAGLATRFNSSTASDVQMASKRGGGLGLHSDYVGSNSYDEKGLPLLGLNQHVTRWGTYAVQFGVLRELEYDGLIAELRRSLGDTTPEARRVVDEAYLRYAGPYTEPIHLGEGDLLIFQAQQHGERGLPGTAHDFITTSDTRRSDVLRPRIGGESEVRAQRAAIASHYELADFGY